MGSREPRLEQLAELKKAHRAINESDALGPWGALARAIRSEIHDLQASIEEDLGAALQGREQSTDGDGE